MLKIAIDRGGTFTDIYAVYKERVYTKKILSQSEQYEDANSEGIREILKEIFGKKPDIIDLDKIEWVRLGTTVGTNALLERKGSDVVFAVTKGFKDLLEIAYQNRPNLFELEIEKSKPLYKRVVEIDERIYPQNGSYITAKELQDFELKGDSNEALAVTLLHSYKNSFHEKKLAKNAKGFNHISISSEISPAIGAVKRGFTAVVDAYLSPVIKEYINKILKNFKGDKEKIYFIKSDGGLCKASEFRGANSVLSGPAGGVVALAGIYSKEPLIGFDMGGTSTDVSRYDGKVELRYESEIAGCYISTPAVDIHTVAAGGGSRLFYKNGMFIVGPKSAGSSPGPLCYGKEGYLSVTDANLVTNRLDIESIPSIFGKNGDEPLNKKLAKRGFEPIAKELGTTVEEVAEAFLDVANEQMANAIKEITIKKGFDPSEHTLCAFGGAGGQHAVAVARKLGIKKVLIHKHSGILSAVGIAGADVTKSYFKVIEEPLDAFNEDWWSGLPKGERTLFIKYEGTNTVLEIEQSSDIKGAFEKEYKRVFGFLLKSKLIVERVKVEVVKKGEKLLRKKVTDKKFKPVKQTEVYINGKWQKADVYKELGAHQIVEGAALILQENSTVLLDSGSKAYVNEYGDIIIELSKIKQEQKIEAAKLSLLANRFQFTAAKMGEILQKAAISTNIKERQDYSCAIFDAQGNLVTNAPHIPVHLGSMGSVVKSIIKKFPKIKEGSYITNVPYEGGSHLPDITVVTPYIKEGKVKFWTASRGHHADIGGAVPGSMPPFSNSLQEEGAVIEAFLVVEDGKFKEEKLRETFKNAGGRAIDDNISDIKAQLAANMEGIRGVLEIEDYEWFFKEIQKVSALKVKDFFKDLKPKSAVDFLDNGAKIELNVYKKRDRAVFDFSKSSIELFGNQNCPVSVVRSAVLYAIRVMLNEDIPLNDGLLEPVEIVLKQGTLLNPDKDLAVVGGNVTTSQRVVDVIFKAFEAAAASQGCMNNVIIGDESFGYYETVAGGSGATAKSSGASGVHTHMTNTKITDAEIVELRYPILINRFEIRKNSGGEGKHRGGDGVIREYKFLKPLHLNLLTERRVFAPYGLFGGKRGKRGENLLVRDKKVYNLTSKASLEVKKNDILILKTPGGGGYGKCN